MISVTLCANQSIFEIYRVFNNICIYSTSFFLKAKSRHSKSAVWRESMKPDKRQVEREDLQRLQSKAEYKRNPRFVPPLKGGLTKVAKKKKPDIDKERPQ